MNHRVNLSVSFGLKVLLTSAYIQANCKIPNGCVLRRPDLNSIKITGKLPTDFSHHRILLLQLLLRQCSQGTQCELYVAKT